VAKIGSPWSGANSTEIHLIKVPLEAIIAIWFNYLGMSFGRAFADCGLPEKEGSGN
jgi:hypothetical protein